MKTKIRPSIALYLIALITSIIYFYDNIEPFLNTYWDSIFYGIQIISSLLAVILFAVAAALSLENDEWAAMIYLTPGVLILFGPVTLGITAVIGAILYLGIFLDYKLYKNEN